MPYSLFTGPNHFFYRKRYRRSWFYIRSMRMDEDIPVIFNWVNQNYALRFWQMQGSDEELAGYYKLQKEQNITSTFFVYHGIQPIALFEVYQVINTELKNYYDARPADYGIHLLMAPYKDLKLLSQKINKVSEKVLNLIVEMLFSFRSVSRVVAEPDSRNIHACRLAEKAGFTLLRQIQLPDKPANLYMITKDEFKRKSG